MRERGAAGRARLNPIPRPSHAAPLPRSAAVMPPHRRSRRGRIPAVRRAAVRILFRASTLLCIVTTVLWVFSYRPLGYSWILQDEGGRFIGKGPSATWDVGSVSVFAMASAGCGEI